jgi:hypothetical protein
MGFHNAGHQTKAKQKPSTTCNGKGALSRTQCLLLKGSLAHALMPSFPPSQGLVVRLQSLKPKFSGMVFPFGRLIIGNDSVSKTFS